MTEENMCDECKRPCDKCDAPIGTLLYEEKMRIFGNGNSGAGNELLNKIIVGLRRARRLHPVFAEGEWQGLGVISGEIGELVRAVEKGEGRDREKAEVIDSIVVLIRFWLEEHELPVPLEG